MKTIKMLAAAAMLLSAVACNSGNTGAKIDGADSTAVAASILNVFITLLKILKVADLSLSG